MTAGEMPVPNIEFENILPPKQEQRARWPGSACFGWCGIGVICCVPGVITEAYGTRLITQSYFTAPSLWMDRLTTQSYFVGCYQLHLPNETI